MACPRRSFALGVATTSAILALIGARVVVASKAELEAGDEARRAGDLDVARMHYRRGARWYAPVNPYCAEALDRLGELAVAAERAGDTDAALASWRAVRAAIVSTRSFYQPHPQRLQRASDRIAFLLSQTDLPPIDAGKSPAELRAEHHALLATLPQPDPWWALLALLGFAAWVAAMFLLASRGIDASDRVLRREVIRWGLVGVVGLLLFVAGISQA